MRDSSVCAVRRLVPSLALDALAWPGYLWYCMKEWLSEVRHVDGLQKTEQLSKQLCVHWQGHAWA